MKAIRTLVVSTLLVASLIGCAATSATKGSTTVKCPACGHEFVVPGVATTGR